MKKLLLAFFALVVAGTAGWGNVMEKDVLLVGTESTYPPYEFRDDKNELKGFDIDMMEAIAEKIGKKIEWVDMDFDNLIPALTEKKIDLVAAGMSWTPERAKVVAFTENYEVSISAFVTAEGNSSLGGMGDVKGKTIAAQAGTTQETYLNSLDGVTVKPFQKNDDCLKEVISGRADAAFMDAPVAKSFLGQEDFSGKIKIAFEEEIKGEGKAIAMNLGEDDLLEAVNDALQELSDSGELFMMMTKWFD
ncbi:MAG: transporter substrate-binding domain-containing protein [Aminivibrio sp.]|jgi:ABC-type amino acid transport substrate-binding protein